MLSIEAKGEEMFGPHYIAFTLPIPTEGDYSILLDALRGPVQGSVQLLVDNKLTGKVVNFVDQSLQRADAVELGTVHFARGQNQLFLQLKGEKADQEFRVDLVRIRCRRK